MQVSFIGRVQSGSGTGKKYVAIDYFFQHFVMLLGQRPFLGTLNVHLKARDVPQYYKSLKSFDPLVIPHFQSESYELWGIECYFVTLGIKGSNVTSEECLALKFDQPEHPRNIVELISPFNLRVKLSLRDRQEVILTLKT